MNKFINVARRVMNNQIHAHLQTRQGNCLRLIPAFRIFHLHFRRFTYQKGRFTRRVYL